jgi:hypothetical protein
VNHTVRVRIRQRISHFTGERDRGVYRKTTFALEPLPKRLTFHIRHDEVRHRGPVVMDRSGVEHREDVGMLQPSDKLDLAKKAIDAVPATQLRADHLDRYRPFVAKIEGQADGRHATGTDLTLDDLVGQRGCEAVRDVAHYVVECKRSYLTPPAG